MVTPSGRCDCREHLGWYRLGEEHAGSEHDLWLGGKPKFQIGVGAWQWEVGLQAAEAAMALAAKQHVKSGCLGSATAHCLGFLAHRLEPGNGLLQTPLPRE